MSTTQAYQQLAFVPAPEKQYTPPILRALPVCDQPVYRLHHAGARNVSLSELLATVVGGGQQIEVAQTLLARYRTLTALAQATPQELAQEIDGLGAARAAALVAALELGRRSTSEDLGEKPQIRSPGDAALVVRPHLSQQEQEHFIVLLLDTRNRVIGQRILYVGTVNQANIRVSEVFREAVRWNCPAIVVAHNHPSGDPTPSPEDVALTCDLVETGELLGIEVLDHLVVGQPRWMSLRERGLGGFE